MFGRIYRLFNRFLTLSDGSVSIKNFDGFFFFFPLYGQYNLRSFGLSNESLFLVTLNKYHLRM